MQNLQAIKSPIEEMQL